VSEIPVYDTDQNGKKLAISVSTAAPITPHPATDTLETSNAGADARLGAPGGG